MAATTIAVSGGTDRVAARLSLGQDYTEGYVPNNDFRRTSALLNGTVNVGSRISNSVSGGGSHTGAINGKEILVDNLLALEAGEPPPNPV